ncbi:SpoIIE family protein phosphatase [Streptacidiphilus sp. 4-A2]|nr:SpoIIE family protein phosphatase [Streptacidiphilus sp. 4-A2]
MAEPQFPRTGQTRNSQTLGNQAVESQAIDSRLLDAQAHDGQAHDAQRLEDQRLEGHTRDRLTPAVPPLPPYPPTAYAAAPRPGADRGSDLTALYRLTERLSGAATLEECLRGVLETGAALVGAQRGMVLLTESVGAHPSAFGTVDTPGTAVGYGLDRAELGALETVPRDRGPYAGLLDGGTQVVTPGPLNTPARPGGAEAPDARMREVARHLGIAACYALPLAVPGDGGAPFGVAVWFYDSPTVPAQDEQRLAALYCAAASPLIALEVRRDRLRRTADALRRSLLPDRLPRLTSVQLAARCLPAGFDHSSGSDWYDALELPDGGLALSVGSVTGGGVECAAAMGRLRAALRAYAVLEGEDPVAVLGDLELLLKATEPARSATALYAYVDPDSRRLSLAGAGQCPPLLVTAFGASFVETCCPPRWGCCLLGRARRGRSAPTAATCCCSTRGPGPPLRPRCTPASRLRSPPPPRRARPAATRRFCRPCWRSAWARTGRPPRTTS